MSIVFKNHFLGSVQTQYHTIQVELFLKINFTFKNDSLKKIFNLYVPNCVKRTVLLYIKT